MIAVSFALSFAGMTGLALSTKRFQAAVPPKIAPYTKRIILRLAASALLLLAWIAARNGGGDVIGTILWLGILSAASIICALMLTYRPANVFWLAIIFALSGGALWMRF